jgi:AcrR family transcriptional regulator
MTAAGGWALRGGNGNDSLRASPCRPPAILPATEDAAMPDAPPKPAVETQDFRTRVAAERRERMRERLLDAVLDLYQPDTGGGPPVIDDVIRRAGVSRGSFYKYFESVEQAARVLGERLLEQSEHDFRTLFGDEPDPAVKAIGGTGVSISRAWHDRRWGGFTVHVDHMDYFNRANATDTMVRDCLEEARRRGLMAFDSLDVAVDLIVGASVQARRRMIGGIPRPRAYADEMLERIFRGLGMEPHVLAGARTAAWTRIVTGAAALGWWSRAEDWAAEPDPASRDAPLS